MRRSHVFTHSIAMFFGLLLCLVPASTGQELRAAEPLISCSEVGSTRAQCLLTGKAPVEPGKLAAQVANTPAKLVYRQHRAEADTVYWHFLVDTSDPNRQRAVNAAKTAITKIVSAGNAKQRFGLSIFSNQLETLVPGPADGDAVIHAANTIRAAGPATELFGYAYEMLGEMDKDNTRRKILVILSDGRAEDTSFTREDVVKRANALGIAIFTIGYPERAGDTPDLQSLRRMSDETNGQFLAAKGGSFTLPTDLADRFYGSLSGMGYLSLIYSPIDTVTPALLTGEAGGDPFRVRFSLDPVGAGPRDHGLAAWWTKAGATLGLDARQMSVVVALICAIILVALILFAVMLVNRRKRRRAAEAERRNEDEEARKISEAISDSEPEKGLLLALLSYEMAGKSHETEIRKRVFTIGRHSQNDLSLSDPDDPATDGISRVHATISLTPDEQFMVRDMGALNKTYVNNRQVDTEMLKDGDTICLGEFALHFRLAGGKNRDDD